MVWPFDRRSHPRRPSVPNHLDDRRPSPPSPSAVAVAPITQSQSVLRRVQSGDPEAVRALVQEASSLKHRLDAMIADSQDTGGHLDRFGGRVEAAYTRLKHTVGQSPDIILRRFTIGRTLAWPALLAFADGMVDNIMVDQDTVRVSELYDFAASQTTDPAAIHRHVQEAVIAIGHVTTTQHWSKLLDQLTYGSTLLFVDGSATVLVLDTVKFAARAIARADSEPSIKGPQEAFNDILLTHMNQIRRHIRTSWLKFDTLTVGGYTKTTVLVAHIEGLTNPALVATVKQRVSQVRVDEVQETNQIVERIVDRRLSLFPLARLTERVDWVCRDLLRGKVAILVDNDPFVSLVPATLMEFYQTTQDYAFSFWEATLVRMIRLIGLVLGLYLLPAYIALTSVDPDLAPTKLILTIAGSREGIPFPPVMEVIIMWIIIEILREAANRLPKELATTLGTVGAVVVGTPIVMLNTPIIERPPRPLATQARVPAPVHGSPGWTSYPLEKGRDAPVSFCRRARGTPVSGAWPDRATWPDRARLAVGGSERAGPRLHEHEQVSGRLGRLQSLSRRTPACAFGPQALFSWLSARPAKPHARPPEQVVSVAATAACARRRPR